jgi:transposase
MTYKNRCTKFGGLLRHFAHDLDAMTIAFLVHLDRNTTVSRCLNLLRKRIADFCEQRSPFKGEIEVDESYFGVKESRAKEATAHSRRPLSFASSNAVTKSILIQR